METLYRSGLRTALAIRNTTGNEISYVESGQFPLECKIRKQQLKFWNTLLRQKTENPHTPLSKLIDYAINLNVKYITIIRDYQRYIPHPMIAKVNSNCNSKLAGNVKLMRKLQQTQIQNSQHIFKSILSLSHQTVITNLN